MSPLAAVGVGAAIATAGPALTAVGPLRRRWNPRLSGVSSREHIALTFDDGPDPASTPAFLDLLAEHGRHATFFVLGEQAVAHPGLIRRIRQDGHEVAIHGWTTAAPWQRRPLGSAATSVMRVTLSRTSVEPSSPGSARRTACSAGRPFSRAAPST